MVRLPENKMVHFQYMQKIQEIWRSQMAESQNGLGWKGSLEVI